MLTAEENDLLCRVQGDAPMGRLMRQHWVPLCLSEEIAEPDGAPLRVRALGRAYVAFRDSEGRVGLLDEQCPHRKASLVYGRNEEGGLRCLYHGWKFGVDGRCLDMSSEPPESTLKEKVRHRAYPVREAGGFVWGFLGDAAEAPPFEVPGFAAAEGARVSIVKIHIPCNWAQIMEGQIDSAHSSSLHSSDMVPARVETASATDTNWLRPSTDKAPRMVCQRTPFGFRYVALRRPMKNAASHDYARITVYLAPFVALIPPNELYNVATVLTPMDDTNTMFHFIAWGDPEHTPDTATWRRFCGAEPGIDVDRKWKPRRNLDNDFLQDRAWMKDGNFTGLKGIPNQDMAMWLTAGPIADRTGDLLGASDLAVVEFRKLMVEAAQEVAAGRPALGTIEPRVPLAEVASFQGIIPKNTNWRGFGAARVELAALEQPAAE